VIKVSNLVKAFPNGDKPLVVLNHINFSIDDGEFVVILGPSGSGKSSFLNVLSGLEMPDSGGILYDDTEISGMNERERTKFRRDYIGFIFQQYYLLPNLTAEQNVRMGSDLTSGSDPKQYLDAVSLNDQHHKLPSQLSGGQQQRVSIARALAKKPKYLFLDEPTGALDEETGRQVLDYISRMHQKYGFTMIMVTHNQNIADMADRVVNMNSGRIISEERNSVRKTAYEIGW
jgi:putative ABC transport system ATP-binding protein